MKCPNCQTENPDVAKFCKGCGAKLEAPASMPTPPPVMEETISCKSCGSPLKAAAKFCPKCGTPVSAKPAYEVPNTIVPPTAPVPPVSAPVSPTAPVSPVSAPVPPTAPVPPVSAPVPPKAPAPPVSAPVSPKAPTAPVSAPVPPKAPTAPVNAPVSPKAPTAPVNAPVPPKAPTAPVNAPVPPKAPTAPVNAPTPVVSQPTATAAPAKEKKGAPIALIIICAIIVIIGVAAVVLFKTGILGGGNSSTEVTEETVTDETTETTESDATAEEAETEAEDTTLSDEELAQIMAPIDTVRDEGLSLLEENDTVGAKDKLSTALNQYTSIIQTHGSYDELISHINDAYDGYIEATIIQVNRLYEQEVSVGLYQQMVADLTAALDLSAKLTASGLDIDSSSIDEILADLPVNYKERYILAINELTQAESWSRSTAWAIMEDVPGLGLYDESDLDDPLRLRYAYSLAMYTRKMNDADIASGAISPRDAGRKILDSIEEMDYNPVMILDAANYFKQAGENYTADVLFTLYDDLNGLIEYYQGLRIPQDIPWERFWYFNDFGTYSVDDTNGVSQECRQEIRGYASEVLSSL